LRRALLALLFLPLLLPLSYSAVGDGVCDTSDVLLNSPDCSPSVYVLTSVGGPLSEIRVAYTTSRSAVMTLEVRNYGERPGIVCFTGEDITLFTAEGNVDRVCRVVAPRSSSFVTLGIRYEENVIDAVAGYLVVSTSYNVKKVPVYVLKQAAASGTEFLSYTVAGVLVTVAVGILLLERLRRG